MFKKFLIISFCAVCLCLFSNKVFAANVTYLVDTPTHSILDYGSYDLQFRIFSGGSVTSKLGFGIFKPLNIGVSWELSNIIGTEDVVVAVPALQIKFSIYGGDENIPGFAIGYDGQGFFYDEHDADFRQKGKGVYFVFGRELFLPGWEFDAGANINDFKDVGVIGFVGSSYMIIDEAFMAMLECDNIGKGRDTRLNCGFRVWITENFDIDFILRQMLTGDKERFGCERILKISYQGRF